MSSESIYATVCEAVTRKTAPLIEALQKIADEGSGWGQSVAIAALEDAGVDGYRVTDDADESADRGDWRFHQGRGA